MTGQTISHYRILEKLGEGGMGVVYKAEDTKLRRTVALKLLPAHLSEHGERFVREAQAVAALNHPNICTIHEVDEQYAFLAMEYVEGTTLRERIAERPLPLKEAVGIALQICAGLQHAHEKGIVHRDVKPANIIVTAQGKVKLMDFGLAQMGDRTRITKTGASLGTPAYMSPEQVRGDAVDRRADIWAATVVLYEMIGGRSPFPGETEQAVAYGIVHAIAEPLTALRSGLPVELDRIVAKGLSKDPGSRYQHLADLSVDLEALRKQLPGTPSASIAHMPRSWVRPAAAGLFAGLCLAGAVFAFVSFRKPVAAPRRFEIDSDATLPSISPDGRRVAYRKDNKAFIRQLELLDPVELPDSEGVNAVAWSPDSVNLAFAVGPQIKIWSNQKRATENVAKMSAAILNLSWDRLGVMAAVFRLGLFRIPANGGPPSLILAPDPKLDEFDFHDPILLPDGTLLCTTHALRSGEFRVLAVRGQSRTVIMKTSEDRYSLAGYLKSGHLLLHYDTTQTGLWAVPVDPATWQTRDTPFRLEGNCGSGSVANDGTLLCVTPPLAMSRLLITDRTGKVIQSSIDAYGNLRAPSLSRDGLTAAASVQDGTNWDIWTFDLAKNVGSRFTFAPEVENQPSFSPSGKHVVYQRNESFILKPVDGSGSEESIGRGKYGRIRRLAWSPDNKFFVLQKRGLQGDRLWLQPHDPEAPESQFTKVDYDERNPAISPDGRFIAYTSMESGSPQLYVRSFPDGEGKWALSVSSGLTPYWSPRGDELFWVSLGDLMVAKVEVNPTFRASQPEKLIDRTRSDLKVVNGFAVFPDGKRLLMVGSGAKVPAKLFLVDNWLASFGANQ